MLKSAPITSRSFKPGADRHAIIILLVSRSCELDIHIVMPSSGDVD